MDFKKFFSFKKDTGEIKQEIAKERSDHKIDNYIQKDCKLRAWSDDRYQSTTTQRNLLLVLLIVCFGIILVSLSTIRYLRNTQSVDPFVIEIEEKDGVPTVVEPLSVKAYSANEAIKRYFVVKYIRAREEYFSSTFDRNFRNVVRVLSTPNVYYKDYRPKFNVNNPSSPYNLYGTASHRTLGIKSIIFPSSNSAQIRVTLNVVGAINVVMNKIIYVEFDFENLNMNEADRLINPLGFQITLFRMNDESS